MAKKIKFESFKYRFLVAAQNSNFLPINKSQIKWNDFVDRLQFAYENGDICIVWQIPASSRLSVKITSAQFYFRGDAKRYIELQQESNLIKAEDLIKVKNSNFFKDIVIQVARLSGYQNNETLQDERIKYERKFHDAWANNEDIENIDVRISNEVCTSPEMRYIVQRLGDIKGKHLLDVGCGLGEASVYFSLLGANVTSSDLSEGMLEATSRLAKFHGVNITQHLASAENMQLHPDIKFDVIYAGNLLHHVNINETISRIKPYLSKNGVFVSWDPLAYNPVINIYRKIAKDVRTPDEHPLKWSDIKLFRKHFSKVEIKYFWFTTLIIFIVMALAQRRNPNKERFWKVIVAEGEKWGWLYKPLEKIDRFLLNIFPPFRLLCWNVVIFCEK